MRFAKQAQLCSGIFVLTNVLLSCVGLTTGSYYHWFANAVFSLGILELHMKLLYESCDNTTAVSPVKQCPSSTARNTTLSEA